MAQQDYMETRLCENPSLAGESDTQTCQKSKWNRNLIIIVACVSVILLLFILCILGVAILAQNPGSSKQDQTIQASIGDPAAITSGNNFASCAELKRHGFQSSGIYQVQLENDGMYYDVYCDMTTDGGGWTLVASVHRKDDGNKCNVSDMWSYNPWTTTAFISGKGSTSWSDKSVMGNIRNATSQDYKAFAYHTGKASDVMLSHVPNDVDVTEFDDRSFLKYHTNNGFLTKYGSSLRSLFQDHARLESLNIVGLDSKIVPLIQKKIKPSSIFTNWYNYTFDTATSEAYMSNQSTPDIGNQVSFSLGNGPEQKVEYGKTYTDSKTYHVTSIAAQPFIAMATVSNFDGYPASFSLKVDSHDLSSASATTYSSSFYRNGFSIFYRVYFRNQRPNKTSVAFAFFNIRSYEWISAPRYSYHPTHPPSANATSYEIQLRGEAKNLIVGYALFTRGQSNSSRSQGVSYSEIRTFFQTTVDLLASSEIKDTAIAPPPAIWTPVVFTRGNISYPSYNVTPGYLQFRAYDDLGSPYAICPGLRVGSNEDPAKFCIGSANTGYSFPRRCGDFSAWETLEDHVFVNRSVSSDGKFVNDLHSTILIFSR